MIVGKQNLRMTPLTQEMFGDSSGGAYCVLCVHIVRYRCVADAVLMRRMQTVRTKTRSHHRTHSRRAS